MTKQLSEGEIIVLGMLAEKPRHGYDLEQTIRERGVRNWTSLGFSSLYYLLEKLGSKGLVRPKQDGAKNRVVFEITPEGMAACRQSVRQALTEIRPYNSFFFDRHG